MGRSIVEDGGTTDEAADIFYEFGEHFLNPVSLLAGCAPPAERVRELVVVVYSSALENDLKSMLRSAVSLLSSEMERLPEEYPQYPFYRHVEDPVPYLRGFPHSLSCALSLFGEKSITDLFVFGHGWSWDRAEPPAEGENPVEPRYSVTVGGISAGNVASACMPFMKPPARVTIEACLQRRSEWDRLSTADVKFESAYKFENRKVAFHEALNDMIYSFHYYDIKNREHISPTPFFDELPLR